MKAYHGSILTVDPEDNVFEYLVEDAGRIIYLGNELPDDFRNCELIQLGDGALCPSFVDTHEHLASFATFNAGLNVMHAKSNREILDLVEDFSKRSKAKTLIAFGASPYSVKEGRLVSRDELDRACPNRPIMMVKYDGHACVVNTLLLNRLKNRLSGLRGYHPHTGEMNQEAFFAVSNYITQSISVPQLIRNIQEAIDYLAERGIGMVHSVSGVGFVGNLDISLEKWIAKSIQSDFQIRIYPQSLNIDEAVKRKIPRVGGCFACALDGCFGSKDAALNKPYENTADCGVLYYSDEKVMEFCKNANRAGLQIELHAIGDAAFDQAVRCIKAALDDFPREDHRHGIIHACLPTEEGIKVCSEYQIQLPLQTSFINWTQEPDAYLQDILGQQRAQALNPLRTFSDNNIQFSAGSDAPCTDPDPIMWMHHACNHSNPEESIGIHEALRMCTYNGYWTSFDEKERGSLEVGKAADMVILSESPYRVPVNQLMRIRVNQLLLSGKPYRNQSQSVLTAILRGMLTPGTF